MRTSQLLLFVFLVILIKETKSSGVLQPLEDIYQENQEQQQPWKIPEILPSQVNTRNNGTADGQIPEILPFHVSTHRTVNQHSDDIRSIPPEKTQSTDAFEEVSGSRAEDTTETENETRAQDDCSDNPCGERGQCRDKPEGGFSCDCEDGWTGTNCSVTACGEPCQNEGVCQLDEHDLYVCNCTAEWSGPACSEDVNECINNPCGEREQCHNEPGGFSCECKDGWTGTNCIVSFCGGPCQNEGVCELNEHDVYACNCTPGWSGPTCSVDVNECIDNPCGEREQCRNEPEGWFSCVCEDGWMGNNCSFSACGEPCQNGGVCELNGQDVYACNCTAGWTGPACSEDVNECINNPCGEREQCHNEPGWFSCDCEDGWRGTNCTVSLCGQPCQNGGVCELNKQVGDYSCNCTAGWTGPDCSKDVDECHLQTMGTYWGWKKTTRACYHGQCENTMGGYQCKCNPGYGGKDCSRWVGCSSEPCENEGTCYQYSGYEYLAGEWKYKNSIRCDCPLAFRGTLCEKENHCYSSPCGSGGNCTHQEEDFKCDCFPGLTGKNCLERDFSVCDDSSCGTNGDCEEVLGKKGYEVSCTCHPAFAGSRCERDLMEEIKDLQERLQQKESEVASCKDNNRIAEESHKREVEGIQQTREKNNAAFRALRQSTQVHGQPAACRATSKDGTTDFPSTAYPEHTSSSPSVSYPIDIECAEGSCMDYEEFDFDF